MTCFTPRLMRVLESEYSLEQQHSRHQAETHNKQPA